MSVSYTHETPAISALEYAAKGIRQRIADKARTLKRYRDEVEGIGADMKQDRDGLRSVNDALDLLRNELKVEGPGSMGGGQLTDVI